MIELRPYTPHTDKRSGTNAHRRGCCSRVWCREPAVVEWTTADARQTRYACATHQPPADVEPDASLLVAAGAGDGVYHAAPFLKKYGA